MDAMSTLKPPIVLCELVSKVTITANAPQALVEYLQTYPIQPNVVIYKGSKF